MTNILKNFKTFFSFATRKKLPYFILIAVTVIASVLSYVLPYFFKLFTDNLLSGNLPALFNILLLLIAIRIAAMIFKNISFFMGDRNSIDGATAVRKSVFRHVQDLDFAFHSDKSTGYLISAFKRGDGAFWTLYFNLHHRFLDVFVGFIVMLFFLSGLAFVFTFIVFATFFITLLLTKYLIGMNIRARKVHNEDEDNLSAVITDNMVNFETVKLFSKETWELKRLNEVYIPWKKSAINYVNTYRVIDLSIGTLINISIFITIYVALEYFGVGKLGIGDFVLILGFINSFYPRLFDLIWGLREVGKDFADIDRYFGLLDYKIEIQDPENPIFLRDVKGEVKLENVTFSYSPGKTQAVKNISLSIREGQSVAFVGRSGGGKTTLIKLLMRFYDVESGRITIDGVDIRDMTKAHLRSFIGVVPQEPIMFNNTISYNICYGREKTTKEELIAAAKMANLHNFIQSLPKKYSTNVGERGVKLSGGQKQRLAIARMILSQPNIIIFDEATSQLDSENENLIQEALWKVIKNKTTIIIAHRLTTAMKADKIVVMDKGKIVEEGSHLALLAKEKGVYKYLWDLQIKKT